MAKASPKLTLSQSKDIPFNKLVLSQANVRRVMAGISIEDLAEDIAHRTLLQSLNVRAILDEAGAETGAYEVPAGGRRFRALELLVKQKRLAPDAPVPCIVREGGVAEEDSLAENVHRIALHPVDQFRAFKTLTERNVPREDIAVRFGVTPTVVDQRLKLAKVSPALLDRCAAGELSLEMLMAFTVNEDHDRQEEVWAAGEQSKWCRDPYHIRRLLTESQIDATDKRAKFIGLENYTQAGGFIARDLFQPDEGGWLQDPVLVEKLVSEKLQAAATAISAEGWKWVQVAVDFDRSTTRGLRKVPPVQIALSEEDHERRASAAAAYDALEEEYGDLDDAPEDVMSKANELVETIEVITAQTYAYDPQDIAISGVFISIDPDGTLDVERGYVRPGDEPVVEPLSKDDSDLVDGAIPATSNGATGTTLSPQLSEDEDDDALKPLPDRLLGELSVYRTVALRNAVANNPHAAMTLLLDKLCSDIFYRGYGTNCLQANVHFADLRDQGPDLKDSPSAQAVDERFKTWQAIMPKHVNALWSWLNTLDDASRSGLLAHCVAYGINAVHAKPDKYGAGPSAHSIAARLRHVDTVARAVGLDLVQAGWRPTVHNYLNRVPKPHILQAVREARGEQLAGMIDHLKKADMATEAERLLEGTGWLPASLRLEPASIEPEPPAEENQLPDFLAADTDAPEIAAE